MSESFNAARYQQQLIEAGVDPVTASEVAMKMQIANESLAAAKEEKKTSEQEIIDSLKSKAQVFDYQKDKLPKSIMDIIQTHLAIEAEDAKKAGTLGFMTRALAIATMPHSKPKKSTFIRKNGDFTLSMMTAHPSGLPYGSLPRILLTWVCTEAVRTQERELTLGTSLAQYLYELGLNNSGGVRGDRTRLRFQMTALFSSVISCIYNGENEFAVKNITFTDEARWWEPQTGEKAGEWQTDLVLSERFFQECIDRPIPIDLRVMKALSSSPLAMDIYVWLTHRMSYLTKRTTIPWYSLSGQFGSNYATNEQGVRDFKRAFLRELKNVLYLYPDAKLDDQTNGLVLYPSPTHILPKNKLKQREFDFNQLPLV